MTPTSLVTGGLGFLGSSIVKALVSRGEAVRILALPGESRANLEGLPASAKIEILEGDIRDPEACRRAVASMHTVYHAAAIYQAWAPDPSRMYEVNLRGTFNMLEASRREGVEKVIYTASIVALGRPKPGAMGTEDTEYDVWGLDFPYSRAKFHSRVLAQDFAAWGLDVRVVCPGIVFGPGDIAPTPSGKLILEVAGGKNPPMYVEGGASYVDVRDAAETHVRAAEVGEAGAVYVAAAHNRSNLEMMQAVGRALGKELRLHRVPTAVARSAVNAMAKLAVLRGKEPPLSPDFFEYSLVPSYYDNRITRDALGVSYRPLDETLRDAIAYFRQTGRL